MKTLDPEPKLTLTIDWDKCIIGKSKNNASVETDRFIGIYLTVTKTENAKDQKEQTNTKIIATSTGVNNGTTGGTGT
ncbi:MAG: hypothetical protein WCP92_04885 [bacterium]